VPALNVPLTERLLGKVNAALPAVLFHVAPELTITLPLKAFNPVAEDMVKVPLVPAPTVVVPVTVRAKPAAVKVVPSPIERMPVTDNVFPVVNAEVPLRLIFPPTVIAAAVVAVADPLKVRLPPIAVVPVCNVLTPLPLSVRL